MAHGATSQVGAPSGFELAAWASGLLLLLIVALLVLWRRLRPSLRERTGVAGLGAMGILVVLIPPPFEWWKVPATIGIAAVTFFTIRSGDIAERESKQERKSEIDSMRADLRAEFAQNRLDLNETIRRGNASIVAEAMAALSEHAPGGLVFRSLRVIVDLTEIINPYLEKERRLLQSLNRPREATIEQAAHKFVDLEVQLTALEMDTVMAYNEGGYGIKISGLVDRFRENGVHDDLMGIAANFHVDEPYTIIAFRDGLDRLVKKFAALR